MSKLLKQRPNVLQSAKQAEDKYQNQPNKKQKSDDFIFKRYRYEQNTIINPNKSPKLPKFLNDHELQYDDKENELENYKKQLEQQTSHFDLIDFGEGEDEEDNTKNQKKENDKQDLNYENPFHFDDEPQTLRNKNQHLEKTYQKPQRRPSFRSRKLAQQFQVKAMELVDFQVQDEESITRTTPAQQNISTNSQLGSGTTSIHQDQILYAPMPSSQKFSLSFLKNHSSQTFMISPDQSLEGGFGIEQSVCNFTKKIKKQSSKEPKQELAKHFSDQNLGQEKYQIHKLSQTDNPFEDGVEYSNQQEELKGVKIYQSMEEDIKVQIYDKDLFVSSKIPPGIILKCKLKRSKGFLSLMNPEFDLYLQNGLKHLISARKNLFRNRELFHLSTEVSSFQRPVRKLMANVLHNTYWLMDAPRTIDDKKISYLDLLIQYEPLDQESQGLRQMTVLCPPTLKTYHIGLEYDIPNIDFEWFKKSISLKLYFKGGDTTKVKNSDKNFELVDSEDDDDDDDKLKKDKQVYEKTLSPKKQTAQALFNDGNKKAQNNEIYHYLKMYKESQNVFDVEIQHPLTPLQAMAIILTRFDAQLK